MRTALAAGVPLAVLPRFGDQPLNARAVEAARAPGSSSRTPRPDRRAVAALLTDPRYAGDGDRRSPAEVDALPPAGEAIEVLRERRLAALLELERADAVVV